MLDYIKDNGCKAGVSIKPETDISKLLDIVKLCHIVLIMTVEPGKGGQELIPRTINKIKELSDYIKENDYDVLIEADGGINLDNAELIKTAGTEILVCGTAIIKSENYKETIDKLKKM